MTRVRLVCVAALIALLFVPSLGCKTGAGQRPPDVAVAQVGTGILGAATTLQNTVNDLTAKRVLPVDIGQKITDANKQVSAKAAQLETALKAYHAATSLADKSTNAAQVQALITELSSPVATMLGVKLPNGAADAVTKAIGTIMSAISAVQAEIARGLSGAPEPLPAPAA